MTQAEEIIKEFGKVMEEWEREAEAGYLVKEVNRRNGIITIIFADGSFINFTEPLAFPSKE